MRIDSSNLAFSNSALQNGDSGDLDARLNRSSWQYFSANSEPSDAGSNTSHHSGKRLGAGDLRKQSLPGTPENGLLQSSRLKHGDMLARKFQMLLAGEKQKAGSTIGGNSIGQLTAGGKEADAHIVFLKQAYDLTSEKAISAMQADELNRDKADSFSMGRKDGMSLHQMRGCKKGVNQIGDSIDFISDLIKKGGKGYSNPGVTGAVGGSGGSGSGTAGSATGTGGPAAGAGATGS